MRISVTFTAEKERTRLPLEYNVQVASLIYAVIASESNQYASRLHDIGYRANGKRFKLFTFSRLETYQTTRVEDALILEEPNIRLQIGSPLAPVIEHLVNGFTRLKRVELAGNNFQLGALNFVPTPEFSERMRFRALSPITASLVTEEKNPTFLSLDDDWSTIIRLNLLGKYEALYGRSVEDQRLTWTWDKDYLRNSQDKGRRWSVLKDIHGIKIRGWLAPFTVEGNPELIEMGYEAGFGARNSMGFGMAEST